MHNIEQGKMPLHVEIQQRLYLAYARAAEAYVKKPTISNWEEKEKAFETYNALFSNIVKVSA